MTLYESHLGGYRHLPTFRMDVDSYENLLSFEGNFEMRTFAFRNLCELSKNANLFVTIPIVKGVAIAKGSHFFSYIYVHI